MKTSMTIKSILLLTMGLFLSAALMAQDLYLPVTTKSKEAKTLYKQAVDAYYDFHYPKGYELLNKALEKDPHFFMAYYLLTFKSDQAARNKYINLGANHTSKLNKGEKIIQRVLKNLQADPNAGNIEEFKELSETYKKNIFAHIMYAYVLSYNAQKADEAIVVLDKCLDLKSDLPVIYNLKGYTYLELEEFKKAEQAFDKYIALAPHLANPYDSKGDYYMAIKAYKYAAENFEKAYEIDNSFDFSLEKANRAKWLMGKEMLVMEVETLLEDLLAAYNERDIDRYLEHYAQSPDFTFVMNGDVVTSWQKFAEMAREGHDKYSNWHVTIKKQYGEVITNEIVIITQLFEYSSTLKEGPPEMGTGCYTTVWQKKNNDWKIVHTIEAFPMKM
ncbi:DUF4440 domain-containing protein [Marinilabiliaceae bacterium JC017]|nr:DUF4440 domain-containing protein [Marinilabiliaceae bacterium JC017]